MNILEQWSAILADRLRPATPEQGLTKPRVRKEGGLLRHTALRFVLSALALTIPASPAAAADRVSIMVGGIEKQIYLPAKLAERLGYFAEQGLVVDLQSDAGPQISRSRSNLWRWEDRTT